MKTRSQSLIAGIFLATIGTGLGQPTIQFSAATYTVAENAGSVSLPVWRLNDTNGVVTVDYATADLTATNGLKYTAVSGTLAFAAGETLKSIVVPILNEGFVEGPKYFRVVLSDPTNAVLGTRTTASLSSTRALSRAPNTSGSSSAIPPTPFWEPARPPR
ncbi:MAG: hypothetical protein NT154_22755 [Verrucomicrobia bacterium]|nr:hypothetical protein [Verrucomicrobiota bacterium]